MIDETLSHLDDITYSKCAYTSVQVSEVDHVELNSDLVFSNLLFFIFSYVFLNFKLLFDSQSFMRS